jgi:hypothetical protein
VISTRRAAARAAGLIPSVHASAVAIEEGHHTFSARGRGGQLIYVVPDLDPLTVITSDVETGGVDPKVLIARTIVPAVTG